MSDPKKHKDHAEIEAKHHAAMNALAGMLDDVLKPYGFTLLVFELAKPGDTEPRGRMNYISNARREDMIASMREFIAYSEGKEAHEAPKTPQ